MYILSPQEEDGITSYWGDTGTVHAPGIIANSQRTPTKINRNGVNAKVRILVE